MTRAGTPDLEDLLGPGLVDELGGRREDLAAAAAAAVLGGRETLAWFRRDALEVREKKAGDPVTAADHAANRAILSVLRERFPDDGIVSEETVPDAVAGAVPGGRAGSRAGGASHAGARSGAEGQSGARASGGAGGPAGAGDLDGAGVPDGAGGTTRLWVVDPLDGTKYFIDGRGEFSVMVGLAENGRAVAGAVYRPDRDVLYLGAVPEGCWRIRGATGDPEAVRLRIAGEPGRPLRFVESLAHPVAGIDRLERELAEVEVLLAGSVGIKCAMIAEGEADLYVHPVPYLGEWDTCAPEAILRGAGGRVGDCAGEPLLYGKPEPRQPHGLFAARPDVWTRVAPTVRAVGGRLLEEQRA